jgi:hypothetical protein
MIGAMKSKPRISQELRPQFRGDQLDSGIASLL